MAYTVLARKYRSRTFDEIAGQDAIATTLKNAVESGRIHHGYLFTGTRGVGKTSMARILAKSLNCLAAQGPTPNPCCKCEACRMIAEGEDIDVVEIDAASNTGVDNIRELRSNAVYRPARSRFKVYIIDEVHMLSTGAFNALLKTLEEPPDHVKFILATTEAHRVPATIQSRCQRFDFRSIGTDTIAGELRRIVEAEGIHADDVTIRRVARLAAGSMRDALSLLDQLMAFGGSRITAEIIDEVLPAPHDELVYELIERIADQDAAGALMAVERCLSAGHTVERLCETLIEHVRMLLLLRVCGADTELIDVSSQVREQLTRQCERFDAPTFVYMVALCEEVRRGVKGSRTARALLDAAVVRLAAVERFSDVQALLERVGGEASAAPTPKKKEQPPPAPVSDRTPDTRPPADIAPVRRAAPVGSARVAGGTTVTSADKRKVMAHSLLRRALELTEGSLVGVRHASRVADPEVRPLADAADGDGPPAPDEAGTESSTAL